MVPPRLGEPQAVTNHGRWAGRIDSVQPGTAALDAPRLRTALNRRTMLDVGRRRWQAFLSCPGSSRCSGWPLLLRPARLSPMTPEVRSLVERMQAFYERTTDFTADFRQDYAYKTFGRTVTSTGTVAFQKPAKMRWDYLDAVEADLRALRGQDLRPGPRRPDADQGLAATEPALGVGDLSLGTGEARRRVPDPARGVQGMRGPAALPGAEEARSPLPGDPPGDRPQDGARSCAAWWSTPTAARTPSATRI